MIKERVLEILKEKGLKQTYLIDKLGVTRQTLYTQLNSETIQLNTANKIANILNVPLYELFVSPNHLKSENCICPYCGKPIKVRLE